MTTETNESQLIGGDDAETIVTSYMGTGIQPTDATMKMLSCLAESDRTLALRVMCNPYSRVFNSFIRDLSTIHVGHFDNMKLEWTTTGPDEMDHGHYRMWVSRMTRADGATFDNEICLEHQYTRGWRRSWGWRRFSRR